MTRDVSPDALRSVNAAATGEEFIALLVITHESLDDAIRVNTSGAKIEVDGDLYVGMPVEVVMPGEVDDQPSRAQLRIDNVSREIALAVERMNTPANVSARIVRAADPTVVEQSFTDFQLRNVKVNLATVTGDVTIEEFTDEPFPYATMTKARFPGIY